MFRTLVKCSAAAVIAAMLLVPASAQLAAPVRQGTTELGVFVGSSYGTDAFRVMGGGNVAYAVTPAIMPYAEFSYFPGLPRQKFDGAVKYDLPLADYHAGVHIRIKLAEHKFVPYGVLGVGVVHNFSTSYTFCPVAGAPCNPPFPVGAANSFAVNFGGGVRYYINQKYGIRFEAKVYKATGSINDIFSKYEFGFFYQIH